jgi:hypothetical protein
VELNGVSPDRRWAVAMLPVNEAPSTAIFAVPVEGGEPRRICSAVCVAKWSPDVTMFYVEEIVLGKEHGVTTPKPARYLHEE